MSSDSLTEVTDCFYDSIAGESSAPVLHKYTHSTVTESVLWTCTAGVELLCPAFFFFFGGGGAVSTATGFLPLMRRSLGRGVQVFMLSLKVVMRGGRGMAYIPDIWCWNLQKGGVGGIHHWYLMLVVAGVWGTCQQNPRVSVAWAATPGADIHAGFATPLPTSQTRSVWWPAHVLTRPAFNSQHQHLRPEESTIRTEITADCPSHQRPRQSLLTQQSSHFSKCLSGCHHFSPAGCRTCHQVIWPVLSHSTAQSGCIRQVG